MSKRGFHLGMIILGMGLLLACNLPLGGAGTPTEIAEVTATSSPEQAGATATTAPTSTPTEEAGCTLDARFVADATIPDGTEIAAGSAFRKTWRLRNSGTCIWEPGTTLVFVSGEPLSGPPSVLAPSAAVGAIVNVSVDFTAPAAPGTYRSTWQLQTPEGARFGSEFYVEIVVPGAAPTSTPGTATPTPTITPAPAACTIAPDPLFDPLFVTGEAPPLDVGCPVATVEAHAGAAQAYTANVESMHPRLMYPSLMVWMERSGEGQIYVFTWGETLQYAVVTTYADSWTEEQPTVPPACAALDVPVGYQLPVRGFGKVWCSEGLVEVLGWPDRAESVVDLTLQRTVEGQMLHITGSGLANEYLIAWNFAAQQARVKWRPVGSVDWRGK